MANVALFPSADKDLLAWAQNLSTRLTAAPITFNVTAAQCTSFATLVAAFATSLAACDPGSRSKATVTTKNQVRDDLKAAAKLLANCVSGSATVTDTQRVQLGLNVRATPTPVPVPDSAPKLSVVEQNGWLVKLALRDATPQSKRAKPEGVSAANLFSYVGATPPNDISQWKFEGGTTRNVFDVALDSSLPPGTSVYFTAFWLNPRMQSGPACAPIVAHVQFGAIAKKAA